MTINGGKPHNIGDRGQRYEVSFLDGKKRRVYGWTDDAKQALRMETAIHDHPTWRYPETLDRMPPNSQLTGA